MWRTVAAAVFAVGLGVAGALYVRAQRPLTAVPDDPGWLRFPNGLRVAVRPIEGATQVAVLTYFGIGCDHDPEGRSGLAHLTEHLYVTSAAGAAAATTADEWAGRYGDGNCWAETWPTFTVCLTKVPPSSLEAEIADAAARMSDLRIEASDLERERPRVLQQIADCEAAAPGPTSFSAGWIAAVQRIWPQRGPGRPGDVQAVSLAEVRERTRRFYGPADARLVLTGAVDAAEAMRLVTKHFADLPGGERAPPAKEHGPIRPGRVDVDCGAVAAGAAVEREVYVAYPGPSRDDPDSVAMRLLERRSEPAWPGQRRFQWMSLLADGVVLLRWAGDEVPVDDVVNAADELVARFAATPPTAEEIDAIASHSAISTDPHFVVAKFPEMLAVYLADGASRHNNPDRIRESLESLTKDDLARFAAKWLDPQNRVVAVARGPVTPPPR